MTVISLRRFVTRPPHPATVTRPVGVARRPIRPRRRTYYDSYFGDPAVVEDDRSRMRRCA